MGWLTSRIRENTLSDGSKTADVCYCNIKFACLNVKHARSLVGELDRCLSIIPDGFFEELFREDCKNAHRGGGPS